MRFTTKSVTNRGFRRELDPRHKTPARIKVEGRAELGSLLRQRRKELGWPLEFAAMCAQVSERTVSELERGVRAVSIDTILRYASGLGIDLFAEVRK